MRIFSLQYHPATSDSTAVINHKQLRSVKGHDAPVHAAEIDSTGTLLATGGAEGLVKVWDLKGGFVTHNFRGHGGVVSALKFYSPAKSDGKNGPAASGWKLASGADDTKVRVWDLMKRTCIAVLDSHVSVVRGLDWSEDGRVLISGSRDKVICLWDCKSWKLRNTIPVLEEVETVGFLAPGAVEGYTPERDPTSQLIYAAGQYNTVRLWNSVTGKEITTPPAQTSDLDETHAISDILYHRNLRTLISVHVDHTLLVHSLTATPTILPVVRTLSGNLDEVIDAQFLGHDDELIALATNSEEVRLVTVSGEFGDVAVLKGHQDIILALDRDPSGHWLASGAKDNDARLWCIDHEKGSYTCYAKFTGHAESIGAIALPRGTPKTSTAPPKFLLTGSQDRTIKKWEVPGKDSKKTPRAAYTKKAHDKDINSIDISPDDTLFASASQDKTVKIWSVAEGETLGVLRGHRRGVWSVRFGPPSINASVVGGPEGNKGGRIVVTGSADKTVRLWSLTDYSCLKTFEGHTNSVLKVIWLPGGMQVGSAGGDGLVKVWDVRGGECSATLDNHEDRVWVLTQSSRTITNADDNDDEEESPSDTEDNAPTKKDSTTTQLTLLSGSSDATLTLWLDTTAATARAADVAAAQLVEQDQKLQNYMHRHDYRSAIELALQLNHPGRLLSLFTDVYGAQSTDPDIKTTQKAVDEVLSDLSDQNLLTLLARVRDWNTNAKSAAVAQRVLNTLVRAYPAQRIVALSKCRLGGDGGSGVKAGGVAAVMKAIESYTERHYRRLEELLEESWVVEYTLAEMGEVAVEAAEGQGGDVEMEDVKMIEA